MGSYNTVLKTYKCVNGEVRRRVRTFEKRISSAPRNVARSPSLSYKKGEPKERKVTYKQIDELRDLLIANFEGNDDTLFVTLTYNKAQRCLSSSSKDFEKWIRRMRKRYGDFRYLGVRSFQRNGNVHFHLLLDIGRVDIKEFEKYWGKGIVEVKKVYRLLTSGKNGGLEGYFLKNLREFVNDERARNQRLLLKSKNLRKPTVIKGDRELIEQCLNDESVEKLRIDKRYISNYLGKTQEGEFILKKPLEKEEIVKYD